MFTVVTRAFATRARAANADDRWSVGPELAFVSDYLGYFRYIGLTLSIETEYANADRLAQALAGLSECDWIDPPRLETAVTESEAFAVHLHEVVERTGRREDLRAVPLDKAAAGETLRMHLSV
jgi:hypothetical protein